MGQRYVHVLSRPADMAQWNHRASAKSLYIKRPHRPLNKWQQPPDDQLLRSSNLTLSDRHLARKRLTSGSEAQPEGSRPDIANLKVGLTPLVHTRSVSCMETRRNEAFERRAYRVLFRAPEQAFGGGIERADSSTVVNDDDRIRRHLGDGRESLPGLTQRVFERVTVRNPHFGKDLLSGRDGAGLNAMPIGRIIGRTMQGGSFAIDADLDSDPATRESASCRRLNVTKRETR
jgi:hypothetical protein